ncbi:IPT/TIG domain-containing protein [Muricauda sp. CAU 1633]|uniref:IPT/TIG domain-containing protein n=1 Tax=Allomuricauda sp. CAU 1633 TaxID=2816036 RepID=UPI001A8E32EC|nr:IPT/TIG domain-containing protein [Muricauda sp. CAU 1633]MBO0320876.1 IPT/TIG domain-containing protein [Muricauda sp. CAU 1633]
MGLTILSCSKDDSSNEPVQQEPKIKSFSPTSGPVGTQITIDGENFGTTASANTVKIGAVTATIVGTPTAKQIKATIPQGAITEKVSVTVGGKTVTTTDLFTITGVSNPTSISLNKSTLALFTFDSETLVPTITGDGSAADIEWSSDDEAIATVDENGNVTGISEGTAIITADLGNDVNVACTVNISASVFAVGYEEINGIAVAKIWKNGVATNLTDGTAFGAATSVFVDGSDIYACGIVSGENDIPTAQVWKNGEHLYTLTDPSNFGVAHSIYVFEGDIYVAGSETNENDTAIANIWKNGSLFGALTDDSVEGALASEIFVNATGIYTAGYEESVQHENGTPKLWEDNTQIDLTDETYHGRAYSVYAVASDVYVAGYEENENGIWIAKYWKNGVATNLSDGSQNADAQSIFVKGEDVYVAGSYYEGQETFQQAVVWKNGTPTNMGSMGSGASSVYVNGEDVYVGGLERLGENSYAVVWKNGTPMELELTEGAGDSTVLSIFIK